MVIPLKCFVFKLYLQIFKYDAPFFKDNQKVSVLKYCDNMVSICPLCFLSRFMFG